MKNVKFLLIAVIVLLIIAFTWLALSRDKSPRSEESDDPISVEQDALQQEALVRWQANCEADGGVWLSEYDFCYDEETAFMMKESCEAAGGFWFEDSMLYECEVNGGLFKGGEWEMIDWDIYEEMKESCLEYDGEWLGGASEACMIDGDTFYQGRWMVLGEMEESCINEFGGTWLGGENTECRIDGVVYPGNWVQIFTMKDSCEDMGGTWLAGDDNQCKVDGQVYSRQAWERIDEMKESCESIGGEYIGGDRFMCDWEGDIYFDKSWERASKAPNMGERCIEDGGTWIAGTRACEGLEKSWCDNILMELDLGAVGWNENSLSCFIY